MRSPASSSFNFAVNAAVALSAGALLTGIGVYLLRKLTAKQKIYHVVFVLGGPGSGKGTVSEKIVEQFGYVHLCAGDLLRAERTKNTPQAETISACIREGRIVSSEITVSLLRKAMEESDCTHFIIDGFPRDKHNYECWLQEMQDIAEIQFLLFLDCPNDVMASRLLTRGRADGDDLESIGKRLATYDEKTRPLIDFFRAQGKVREVDANRPLAEVLQEVTVHFSNAQYVL